MSVMAGSLPQLYPNAAMADYSGIQLSPRPNFMTTFDLVLQSARRRLRRVVLPETQDPRILAAAAEAHRQGLARPILLGNQANTKQLAEQHGISLEGVEIIDIDSFTHQETYIQALIDKRRRKGRELSRQKAEQTLRDPLSLACLMVDQGRSDACVAGAATATAEVIRCARRYVGPDSADEGMVSSCFLMLLRPGQAPGDVLFMGDCALTVDPDAEQLARIAIATGETARQLTGLVPEIAMLSFSTSGSARHPAVSKVRQASALARQRRSHWRIVGEVQLDAAVIPDILSRKAPDQPAGNPCNVLIFPNLDAGNIGYKMLERFGGARAVGPILQGLHKPVNDLSRGCSTADVVNLIAVSAAQVVDQA